MDPPTPRTPSLLSIERTKSSRSITSKVSKKSKISSAPSQGISIFGPKGSKYLYGSAPTVGPLLLARLSSASGDGSGIHRRKIGLLGCIIVILGCVLGSGIFAAPEQILRLTENAGVTLLVWFVAGVLALIAALSFIELGCTFPVSGGDYAYLYECFGNYPAFMFQVSHNFIVIPVCGAIMSSVIAKNLILPNIDKDLCLEKYMVHPVQLFSIMLNTLFAMINCKNPYLTGKIQGALMIVNISAIVFIIGFGLTAIGIKGGLPHGDFKLALKPGSDTKGRILIIVKALYQASFSYIGYTYANYITEELENPVRILPLGIFISIPIIICINLLINFCYITTLSLNQMKNTQTIADDMFRAVLPDNVEPYMAWMATAFVAVAVCGGLASFMLTASRISYAGARRRDFPSVFKLVDMNHGTPVVSIIFISVLSSCFTMVGTVAQLIELATYLETLFNTICIYGLIYVRIKRPNLPRPIKFPLIMHCTYAIIATFLFVYPIIAIDSTNYKTSLFPVMGIASLLIIGTPLYFIFIRTKRNWPWLIRLNGASMKICQKMWLVIPDNLDEDEFEEQLHVYSSESFDAISDSNSKL